MCVIVKSLIPNKFIYFCYVIHRTFFGIFYRTSDVKRNSVGQYSVSL